MIHSTPPELSSKRLLIIGAGPKSLAVAAKAAVLAQLGFTVPEIHIFERRRVGANWAGGNGYTNGHLALGTAPEKDVGFPYRSTSWGDAERLVDIGMQAYSWQTFLVSTGRFARWIDRGRPAPEHRDWADYLRWVADQLTSVVFHQATVKRARIERERWTLEGESSKGEFSIDGDALMLTGPGRPRWPAGIARHPRILTLETFWSSFREIQLLPKARVAIVGAGESAASMAMALTDRRDRPIELTLVTPNGMCFSRGENFRENQVYSDPSSVDWSSLTMQDRRNFISRTDRGVISGEAQRILERDLRIVAGQLRDVTQNSRRELVLTTEYDRKSHSLACDYVLLAVGSDHSAALRELFDAGTASMVHRSLNVDQLTDDVVEASIGASFQVGDLAPALHLPMLAALNQGPGFANLSCLGTLADRVLVPYVRGAAATPLSDTKLVSGDFC